MSKMLEVSGLCMRFGGLLAVNQVALEVGEKQIVSIIGPNGAGKTTIFNCLTGFYRPTDGVIRFSGTEIQGLPGHQIARKGVVRTFQHVRLFKEMTVLENLLVAQHRHLHGGFLSGILKLPAFARPSVPGWSGLASGWIGSVWPSLPTGLPVHWPMVSSGVWR